MSTLQEVEAALTVLSDQDLHQIDAALHRQFRQRKLGILYDDAYGIWTEEDQISAAAEAFLLMDQEESRRHGIA